MAARPTLPASPTLMHQTDTALSLPTKRYDQNSNIDWTYEYDTESLRRYATTGKRRFGEVVQRWMALVFMATAIGLLAGAMDISLLWLHNIRSGFCTKGFYLTEAVCCTGISDSDTCDAWKTWNTAFHIPKGSLLSFFFRYFIYTATSLILAAVTAVVMLVAPNARRSGISEIKAIVSGLVLDSYLTPAVLMSKAVGLVTVVSSGIWVGKEGPLVHVACCLAELVSLYGLGTVNQATHREMMHAAAAAGIAVAFNAPIGGVLFTLEQFNIRFHLDRVLWHSFVCAAVAVVVLQLLSPFDDGSNVLFTVDSNNNWLFLEIFPFMLLGVLGGVYGYLFNRTNLAIARARRSLIGDENLRLLAVEVLVLALVTSLCSFPLLFSRLPLPQLITRLFRDCASQSTSGVVGGLCEDPSQLRWKTLGLLLLTGVQGFALACYSYGTLLPGGVLMPSMALGAITGRLFGIVMQHIELANPTWQIFAFCSESNTCISPGSYAVVGAAATLTGVTKMTVSVVVIMFELTGALTYVLPIMIAVLVARFVSDALAREGCYELWLKYAHLPYYPNTTKPLPLTPTCELMRPMAELEVIYHDEVSLGELRRLTQTYDYQYFPLLQSAKGLKLIGLVQRLSLASELAKCAASDDEFVTISLGDEGHPTQAPALRNTVVVAPLVETNLVPLSPNLPLPSLVRTFKTLGWNVGVVVLRGAFLGLVTRQDIVNVLSALTKASPTGPRGFTNGPDREELLAGYEME